MRLSFPSPGFDDVVAAVCHGSVTETEAAALNLLLRSDPRARDEYLLRIEIHARLASEPDLSSRNAAATMLSPPFSSDAQEACSRDAPTQAVSTIRRRWARVLALAASLMLALTGVWVLWLRQAAARNGATSTAVAMLTRAIDARWEQGNRPLRAGNPLKPGWIRLRSGLAQVVFYSGARVVIEGPATLRLVSPHEAACSSGRLLVEVPEPARGFRIKTDHLSVIDLGTSFGIDASPNRTEVHVFQGSVELHSGSRVSQPLGEREAVAVHGKGSLRLMAANEVAFASMLEFQQRSLAAEAFRYEQWQFASAQRKQDPSLVVFLDFEKLHSTDWTLPNAAERNRSVQEATLVGCVRSEGRWREKQSLEFQSVNDRVRLAVPGEFDALTLSAWVCVKGLDRKFNSLFMSDAFEPGTLHWLIRDDGVLGLTLFGPDPGKFQILASPPAVTLDAFGTWLHLAVVLDGSSGRAVHYVNGDPVSHHLLEFGPPFRIGSAELGNWYAPSGPNHTPFLVRHLSAAFDEFALFSRALSHAEVRGLYATGKPDP